MTIYQARSIERRHARWLKCAKCFSWLSYFFLRMGERCLKKAEQTRNELQ